MTTVAVNEKVSRQSAKVGYILSGLGRGGVGERRERREKGRNPNWRQSRESWTQAISLSSRTITLTLMVLCDLK